jgi:hypothetical protein
MQPYFFPYIGYFQLLNSVDKFVIYDDVNFIKGGWINRNLILLNGDKSYINVLMNGSSSFKKINEIKIDKNRYKSIFKIEQAYKNAPYFHEFFPVLKEIILNDSDQLSIYLTNSIKKISNYLGINTEFYLSSNIEKDNNLKGQDKVIEICKKLNSSIYINSIGGKQLYSKNDFLNENIDLKYIKSNEIIYNQFNELFISNLSIIDVLMFNNKENIKVFLNDFELID